MPHSLAYGGSAVTLATGPERGYRIEIRRGIAWQPYGPIYRGLQTEAASFQGEMSIKIAGAERIALGALLAGAGRAQIVTYTAPSTVSPFGPQIDCSAGVPVVVRAAPYDRGRIGSRSDCWSIRLSLRYAGEYTPAAGDLTWLLDHKPAQPVYESAFVAHDLAGSGAAASNRSGDAWLCQIQARHLSRAQAAAAVDRVLSLGAASFVHTWGAGLYPFGPDQGSGPHECVVTGLSVEHVALDSWVVVLELARVG